MSTPLRANFIGCGKLGKTLAYLLTKNKFIVVQNIITKSKETSQNAIEFIGQGEFCTQFSSLKEANVYFFCTPDDQIKKICEQLVQEHKAPLHSIFVHFSGVLTSDELKSASDLGYATVSLHPIKSFGNLKDNIQNIKGTMCSYEGAAEFFDLFSKMISGIGGELFSIQKETKKNYHIGCVIASNYLVTIANMALQCFHQCEIPTQISKNIILTLMQSVLSNLSNSNSFPAALTGPLQRGDAQTIEKHISTLKQVSQNQPMTEFYRVLGKLTLEMTSHEPELKEKLRTILEK